MALPLGHERDYMRLVASQLELPQPVRHAEALRLQRDNRLALDNRAQFRLIKGDKQ